MSRSLDTDFKFTKQNSHTSYERYKANLHAIFDGRAPMPAHIQGLAGAQDPASESKPEIPQAPVEPAAAKAVRRRSVGQNPYSIFVEALKRASTHDEMQRAVGALKEAGLSLPADEDLLSKVLTHPDENLVAEVLELLEGLFGGHPPKSPRLLLTRLEDAAFLCKPGATKDRILAMKAKYRA